MGTSRRIPTLSPQTAGFSLQQTILRSVFGISLLDKNAGWLTLLPNGGYVTRTPSGEFTASDNAEPHLAVEVGKRRWPLADVPAFKKQYFRKDGVNLLAPAR